VEDRSQAEKSNADHCRQQSCKEGIPGEGPAEEEGCCVEEEKHQVNWFKRIGEFSKIFSLHFQTPEFRVLLILRQKESIRQATDL
jgi:hypothetical protein